MIGISWRREQGLADPLLKRMVKERGLDDIPQWTKKANFRLEAHNQWMELAKIRDGLVNDEKRNIKDIAALTSEAKSRAKLLGADLVGIALLQPIMIDLDFQMPHKNVIGIVLSEDYEKVLKGSLAIEEETFRVYVQVAKIATELASWIRGIGYPAWAHHNGITQIQAIPTLFHCGIGELGRHGSLINPDLSANFRPSFVTTDLPLEYDEPLEIGVPDFCENCNLCRNNCPGDAIATDYISTEGIKRWLIDMEKCYPYSRLHEAYCHICVDVCPYVHKENGDTKKRLLYKTYMKQRKVDGYRSPNRL